VEQSVIHRTITVAPGRFAPGHLGELTQQVPFELVDAVLVATGRTQARIRDLPARVVSTCCWPGACSRSWAMCRSGSGSPPALPASR
jgi:hypothetical protein